MIFRLLLICSTFSVGVAFSGALRRNPGIAAPAANEAMIVPMVMVVSVGRCFATES